VHEIQNTKGARGAFDSAQAPPRAWVLRVDRSQLRRFSANGRDVNAVGLSIKNWRTWLRRLSGAEAKGAGLKSAERSRRWLSVAEAKGAEPTVAERSRSQWSSRGAFDSAQAPPRKWVLRVDKAK
jgi:hypothetical protein